MILPINEANDCQSVGAKYQKYLQNAIPLERLV